MNSRHSVKVGIAFGSTRSQVLVLPSRRTSNEPMTTVLFHSDVISLSTVSDTVEALLQALPGSMKTEAGPCIRMQTVLAVPTM